MDIDFSILRSTDQYPLRPNGHGIEPVGGELANLSRPGRASTVRALMPAEFLLADRLPPRGASGDELLDLFLGHVKALGLTLYPAQEEALLEIFANNHVILSTPTGSGKSLVALAMHFLAMAQGKRSFYTAPIKALVNEKFFALCEDFGPENVGMLTGDAAVNRDAPIICCTAEVLANMALRDGRDAPADYVIMDEFHYFADKERGVAWQIPLLILERATFLLMSATLGPTERFEEALLALTGRRGVTVRSTLRPVPLDFEYRETPLHETIPDLVRSGKAPVYVVSFTQRGAAELAQDLMSVDFTPKEKKKAILLELAGFRFDTPYGKDVARFVRHGLGIHHAGLLPKYRRLVERLAQKGLLAVISGTDTLGVGVNIPIRTVLFTRLCKFDGEKTAIVSARDFHQISGRAGRKGFDDQGSVVAEAPEHVIENLRLEAKAGNDPLKKKRFVRKKPPDRGYVHWDRATFDRLVASLPEPLESQFSPTHGMLLQVLERPGGGCMPFARLIKRSLEPPAKKRVQGKKALSILKSLLEAEIITKKPEGGVEVHVDLQEDFSLHHALSLWLIDTIPRIQAESETYALDVLTLVESILENPEFVLRQQASALKTAKMAELKQAGMEFEERIAELDKVEYPKPNAEFIYETFNAFARAHPWAQGDNIRPKSIAREMYEKFMNFNEYVREYELARAEGVLLRYLSEAYKALVQSVPAPAKTAETDEIELFLGTMVRAVDASLLEEWEELRSGDGAPKTLEAAASADKETPDVTRDERAFTVLVRNVMFQLVKALAKRDSATAEQLIDPPPGGTAPAWPASRVTAAMEPFFAEHAALRTDPAARAPANTRIEKTTVGTWKVSQALFDAEEANDWVVEAVVDLERSRNEGRPVVWVERIGL
jgi:superfamily II RNA helicase